MDAHPTTPPSRRQFLKELLLGVPMLLAAPRVLFAAKPLTAISLSFLSSSLPLIRRSAWASRKPIPTRLKIAGFFSRITVHHSGSSVLRHTERRHVAADLNNVLNAHMRIRYGDIGYHLIVDYGGRVWEGRSLSYEGAHVSGANTGNIGVMLLGNFEKQQPSAPQLETLGRTVSLLRGHFDIPARRVFGHRDIGSSVCPGRYLYPHVVAMKSGKTKWPVA